MEEGGPSTGSGWESMLLSSAMFAQDARGKAVAALARGKWQTSAPSYMQGLPYEDLRQTNDTHLRQNYTLLLQRLTGTTEVAPPVRSRHIEAPNSVTPLFGGHSSDTRAADKRILPPIVTLPTRYRMPYRSLGSRFAGRVEPLWKLHDLLHQDDTAVIEGVGVVIGAGGLGKTQLATEYVHRFGNYYPGGVFWTDADQGLAAVVQQIAASAQIAIDGALPVEQQREVLWQSLGQTPDPVLIVFDNFSETEALQPWLPVGANLKALVTTRRRDLAYPKVPLTFLSRDEGLELLNSGERAFGSEAIPLIDTLGGLPLALELSCDFLNRSRALEIDTLLAEIARLGEINALDVFAEHYKNELPTGHEKAVGATFQLSWNLASEAEQKILRLMGWWAPSPVPRRLLKRAMGNVSDSALTDPVGNGISALEMLSLVELDEDYDPQIHRLLRGFIRTQTHEDDEETKTQAVEAVKTELSRTRTETDTAALTELEKVLPHAQMVLDTKIAEPEHAIAIASYMRWHQGRRGRYQLAKVAGQHALALAQQSSEPGHPSIATSQSNLALVLQDLGDLEGAKTLLIQSYETFKNLLGEDHSSTLTVKGNLESVESEIKNNG
jgi:tetratricopeptide repeat protein